MVHKVHVEVGGGLELVLEDGARLLLQWTIVTAASVDVKRFLLIAAPTINRWN